MHKTSYPTNFATGQGVGSGLLYSDVGKQGCIFSGLALWSCEICCARSLGLQMFVGFRVVRGLE